MEKFMLPISELTPSQLYISEEKLSAVKSWFDGDTEKMDPIPIKRLAGRLLITDGHTRSVAAYLSGTEQLPCVWDTDDMDWAAYAGDINMCAEEGVLTVKDLSKRIVPAEAYKKLWHERCDAMYGEWFYKVLKQEDEVIFFTRDKIPLPKAEAEADLRPADADFGNDDENILYYKLYCNGLPVARGCIEKYSYEFWEAADIRTEPEYRGHGFGFAITAAITNLITAEGKTATCRTLPGNAGMNAVIKKCGYEQLYI